MLITATEFVLVVTDMMMPYMDGTATIRAIQKMNPQVKNHRRQRLKARQRYRHAGQSRFSPQALYFREVIKYYWGDVA